MPGWSISRWPAVYMRNTMEPRKSVLPSTIWWGGGGGEEAAGNLRDMICNDRQMWNAWGSDLEVRLWDTHANDSLGTASKMPF